MLMPGEDQDQYITVPATGPATGMRMLAHKANGECVYLGKKGCTIHDRAPIVCKAFDCRRWLKAILDGKHEPLGGVDQETLDAAWARIDTL